MRFIFPSNNDLIELRPPAEFDLDTDDIETPRAVEPVSRHERDIPVLVGLFQESSRRSLDISLHALRGDEDQDALEQETPIRKAPGGGMIESIANMANSILGAGNTTLDSLVMYVHIYFSHPGIIGKPQKPSVVDDISLISL
jgi:hypothetical protein